MANWTKVGMDAVAGGIAGAVDQLAQNRDEKKGKLPMMQQFGTYVNYGLPILGVVAVAMGLVRGDDITRVAVISGQLAGRKITHTLTTKSATPSAYTAWQREKAASDAAWARTAQRSVDVPGYDLGIIVSST